MELKIQIELDVTLNQSILFFLDYMRSSSCEMDDGPTEKDVRAVLGEMTLTSFFADVKVWVEDLIEMNGLEEYDGLCPTYDDCKDIIGFDILYQQIAELMYLEVQV